MRIRNAVNFAIVPEWILYADISPQAIRLYGVLNRHADKIGRCHPSRSTLADIMRVTAKTVDRAMDELERIGAVTISKRFTNRGDQTSNQYTLQVVPKGATQMSMGVDTDDETPLDTDVPQNESHSELDPPTPPQAGGTKRPRRSEGTNPRSIAKQREVRELREKVVNCTETRCDHDPDQWTKLCGSCAAVVRRLAEVRAS